jgi:hypothetical protein
MRWASILGADAGMARVHLALLSGCLWVGPAGVPLAYARGSVEVRGEEEESAGAHRFCDLAKCRLPPSGVVCQGAISWVMFRVFGGVSRGDGGVLGFRRNESRQENRLFSTTLGLFPPFLALGGCFRPLGGRLPLGKVASFGAPRAGENVKRACSVGCRTSPHSFIIPVCQGTEGCYGS